MKKALGSKMKNEEFGKRAASAIEPNPPHGEKGEFRKITITLPPAAYELLLRETTRRKLAGEKDHLVSSVVREAILSYLKN
jgi:transcriptional regulator of met regulon